MDRLLAKIAKPWEGSIWILAILLAFNRIFILTDFGLSASGWHWYESAFRLGLATAQVFLIAMAISISMAVVLKVFVKDTPEGVDLNELFLIGLKAQSPFLMAAPLSLILIGLSGWVDADQARFAARLIKSMLTLATFYVLYTLIKSRLKNLKEIQLVALVFSPYLALFSLIAAAALIFISAVVGLVLYFSLT